MTLREKIAATAQSEWAGSGRRLPTPLELLEKFDKARWMQVADAILAEMRDNATPKMRSAGWIMTPTKWDDGSPSDPDDTSAIWDAMISAALAEKDG